MPPACVYTFYFFWRDCFTLGVTLVSNCVSGAPFFIWRDFFCLARLFLIWGALFYLARLFLSGVSYMPAPGYGPYLFLIV